MIWLQEEKVQEEKVQEEKVQEEDLAQDTEDHLEGVLVKPKD